MTAYSRMLQIPWTDHRMKVFIKQELKIQAQDVLLITIKSQILKFFGLVIRNDGVKKDSIQGRGAEAGSHAL